MRSSNQTHIIRTIKKRLRSLKRWILSPSFFLAKIFEFLLFSPYFRKIIFPAIEPEFSTATNHEQIGCAYSERDKYITGGSLSLSMRIVRAGRVFYRENVYLACAKARGTGRTGSIGRPLSGIGNKCRPDIEIWPIISRGEGLGMGFFAMGK